MSPPSLRNRIRNGTLAMLVIAVALVALALPEVHSLGGAIRRTLYRNYLSIEAAQHMHAALWNLQVAARDGRAAAALPASRDEFIHWIRVEENDITEPGEAVLAREIDDRGAALFAQFELAFRADHSAERCDRVVRPAFENGNIIAGNAEHLGNHGKRKWCGKLMNELGRAAVDKRVDKLIHSKGC